MKVSAVLLAAGNSSRMGDRNKLLLPLGEKVLFSIVYENLLGSKIEELVVVTGFEFGKIEALIPQKNPRVKIVHHAHFQNGMTSSIQFGIQSCAADTDGLMICLSDMPFLKTGDYNKIINAFQQRKAAEPCIIAPICEEQQRNPVLFSTHFKNEILAYSEPNGCKKILQKYTESLIQIPFENASIFADIDTPEMYKSLETKDL